jgi:hypothetical protein
MTFEPLLALKDLEMLVHLAAAVRAYDDGALVLREPSRDDPKTGAYKTLRKDRCRHRRRTPSGCSCFSPVPTGWNNDRDVMQDGGRNSPFVEAVLGYSRIVTRRAPNILETDKVLSGVNRGWTKYN